LAGPIAAQESATLWQNLTRNDIEAAYAQLRADHPGTTPEAGDPGMVSRVEQAHAKALERVAQVSNLDGYGATLGEFANSLGDGHLRSTMRYVPRTVYWAGLIMAKHGPDWVVANQDTNAAGADLLGAHLLSCDGIAVNDLARDSLKFRTNPAVEALMVLRAPWLLVDEGNPFLQRPKACEFDKGGTPTKISLKWTRISRSDLLDHHWHKPYGEAGFAVRTVKDAVWIGLGDLSGKAQAVIDAATAKAEEIRHAPYVVIDVRGNGGGDDAYGRALAAALFGADYAAEKLGPEDAAHGGCDEVFRASPDNIRTIGNDVEMMERTGDSAGAAQYRKAVEAMKHDTEMGKTLTGDLTCKPKPTPAKTRNKPLLTAKLFLLTDSACFSSCIQVVDFFRKLGAIQVGLQTAADTHYSEVTDIALPSGLSSFSTLRAYMPDYPLAISPFTPRYSYEGDIGNSEALENWISGLAADPSVHA
jgi:hypothetical protein